MARVVEVRVDIVRFVTDGPIPGFVECLLVDSSGRGHLFVDKVPIFSQDDLTERSNYPCDGSLAAEVETEWIDDSGCHFVRINTARPHAIESTDGATIFVIRPTQLARR